MKKLEDIYQSLRKRFFNNTSIDVDRGTAIDYFMLATSEMIEAAHAEIDNNKTPHVYSGLTGNRIDDMAILVGLTRKAGESDTNFLYRVTNWNTSNKSSNSTAIETALMDLVYVSNATHVPHVHGCGTCAIYIIPKDMAQKEIAIEEVKSAIKDVISPSTYIDYVVPTIRDVRLILSYKTKATDKTTVKKNIEDKLIKYVNAISPGDYLELGEINKIGLAEGNVDYFNVVGIQIDSKDMAEVSILQKLESKLILVEENINWVEVE